MHEVYIAMELTIYIFIFNPSINEIVFIASKKKSIASGGIRNRQSGCKPLLEPFSSPLDISFIIVVILYATLTCCQSIISWHE